MRAQEWSGTGRAAKQRFSRCGGSSTASEAMCLGVPGRVQEIRGQVAVVDFWGVRRETRLDVVDEPVEVGDWVLNHVGYAIRKIPASEVEETLALYERLLEAAEGDLQAEDVRGEMASGSAGPNG